MRTLFSMDAQDYCKDGKVFSRPSVRAILISKGKLFLVHSLRYDYYKFPGGGIEKGETHLDALIRETKEETGLRIQRDSIREYGYVHRVQKDDHNPDGIFAQDNFYYFAKIEEGRAETSLDAYEEFEEFTLECIDPVIAIETNRTHGHGPTDPLMLERETKVLEFLLKESIFQD